MANETAYGTAPTEFELRVLKAISKGWIISGDKMVAYVAAARRLEKKGLAQKGIYWSLTQDGNKTLRGENDGE